MKTHAKTNLLASSLQQRHMPGELFSYPLTPVQTPRHSHCPTPSPEPSLPPAFCFHRKQQLSDRNTQRNYFPNKVWSIYCRRACLCMCMHVNFVERGGGHERVVTWLAITHLLRDACTGWVSCQHFLGPLPPCHSAHVPNQTNTRVKWHTTPLKLYVYIYIL